MDSRNVSLIALLTREQEKELYCLRSLSNDIGAEITEPLSGTAFVLAPEQQDHIISSFTPSSLRVSVNLCL